MADNAGASAQLEYERRHRRDRAAVAAGLKVTVPAVVGAAVAVFIAVKVVARIVANRGVAFPQVTVNLIAVGLAVSAALNFARVLWGRRQSTDAWRVGAAGERATALDLEPLTARGFTVLHDRKLPKSRANVDHIVVGPTGVFTVETKNYGGSISFRRRLFPWRIVIRHSRRGRLDGVVAQAHRQADAVVGLVDANVGVTPLVVVRRAELLVGWFAGLTVDGVRWCRGGDVVRVIDRGPFVLSDDEVAAIVDALIGGLRSGDANAPAGTCACGAEMVLRHRRADGGAFLGCSDYPRCRRTRALAP